MRIELTRLHRELGATMIYVTHDQVEAMTMGDRIAVFHQGRIAQLGAPMSLYEKPADAFVAAFLGAPRINFVDRPGAGAEPAHQALWAALAPATALPGVQRAGLRAEHLHLRPAGDGIPAQVILAEHLGDTSILHLRVAGVPEALHAKLGAGHAHLARDTEVGLRPDAAWALAFDAQGRSIG
jgi:multiple sugar transport system ATP-binding protein